MLLLVPAAVQEELSARVAARFPEVSLLPYSEEGTSVPGASEAEGILRWIAGKRYERLVLEGPRVRWLHTASAGVDHVLTPALRQRGGFMLTDSGPAFGICIGEFVLAWMLAVTHCLPQILEQQRERRWQWVTQEELHGQTVGVIGLGPVGQGIAERCRAMGMRVLGLRRRPEPVSFVDETLTGDTGLRRILTESDWVIIAAASTAETRHLLGSGELALLKPTARLINVARGALIDESALITILHEGRVAGACLDVFAKEPLPPDSPLWDMPNVYVTPHTSPGWTNGLKQRQFDLFLDNLDRFRRGDAMEGVVDFERGY